MIDCNLVKKAVFNPDLLLDLGKYKFDIYEDDYVIHIGNGNPNFYEEI